MRPEDARSSGQLCLLKIELQIAATAHVHDRRMVNLLLTLCSSSRMMESIYSFYGDFFTFY